MTQSSAINSIDDSIDIGSDGIAASQHILAKASHAAAAKRLSDEIAVDSKAAAVLRSTGGPGAGMWMKAPTMPNQHMSNAQFCIAIRTRMLLPIPQCVGRCQHRRTDGTLCDAALDEFGFREVARGRSLPLAHINVRELH